MVVDGYTTVALNETIAAVDSSTLSGDWESEGHDLVSRASDQTAGKKADQAHFHSEY